MVSVIPHYQTNSLHFKQKEKILLLKYLQVLAEKSQKPLIKQENTITDLFLDSFYFRRAAVCQLCDLPTLFFPFKQNLNKLS